MTAQTPLADLNACSRADFRSRRLQIFFEYSPWIAEKAADARPFAGVRSQLFRGDEGPRSNARRPSSAWR